MKKTKNDGNIQILHKTEGLGVSYLVYLQSVKIKCCFCQLFPQHISCFMFLGKLFLPLSRSVLVSELACVECGCLL